MMIVSRCEWSEEEKTKIRQVIRAGGSIEDAMLAIETPMQRKSFINRMKRELGLFAPLRRAHLGTTKLSTPGARWGSK